VRRLRELLSCLDRLEEGTDDPDFEQDLRKAQDVAAECFKQWLRDSGGTVNPETLTQFVRMYLEYLYGYSPDRDVGLSRSVPRDTVREFLLSHLTRKLFLEDPSEYAYAPPAFILFHQFLQRSGWLSGQLALEATQSLLEAQPEFTEMLRRHYS
jgi:hypothetical protein